MTLTHEESSNKNRYEKADTSKIVDIIRTAMSQGCIRPCHVYDAVDEIICRAENAEAELSKVRSALDRLCNEVDDVIDQTPDGRYVIESDCEGIAVALEGAKIALERRSRD